MNQIIKSPSALVGQNNYTESPFRVMDIYDPVYDPFTFKDVVNFVKGKVDPDEEDKKVEVGNGGMFLGAIGSIASILPQIGIGSKSRIRETKAEADAQSQIYNAQAAAQIALTQATQSASEQRFKDEKGLLLVGGVMIFLILVVFLVLK